MLPTTGPIAKSTVNSIKEFLEEKVLLEINLARVKQHVDQDEYPVAIISAFRGERPEEENVRLNKQLASSLRKAGYGYVWVNGAWIENKDTPAEVHKKEVSLLVVGQRTQSDDELFEFLKKQTKKYNQDGFIFKPSNKEDFLASYDKNGKKITQFSNIHYDRFGEYYTQLRKGSHAGRAFVFEGIYRDLGWIAKMSLNGKSKEEKREFINSLRED